MFKYFCIGVWMILKVMLAWFCYYSEYDFGSHDGLMLLLLWTAFWKRFQIMRSRCQDECEADVKITNLKCVQSVQDNAKPKSGWMWSRRHDNAKPMSRRMWSRCQDECEADVRALAKPMLRMHSHAHTPNGSTHAHKKVDAKWKHSVRYLLPMFVLITSLPSISLAQYSATY